MFNINDRVGLVTGAAKGIGLSIARELLKNGAKGVSIVDIDVSNGENAVNKLQNEFGSQCALFCKADITNDVQFEEAFKATIQTFKQLDIVVNNAGIMQEIQWRKCVAVNFEGVISGSRLAMEKYLPEFKSGTEGVVINIASGLGITPIEHAPIYAATKSGIIALGRSIGGPVHYEKYKVRVVTICPSLTDTEISHLTIDQQIEPFKSLMRDVLKNIPSQSTEAVADNVIEVIQNAPNGSVWLVERGNRVEVKSLYQEIV